MMWMIPLATAAMGAMSAKKKQDQQESNNKAQAEITRYSPWTGMHGQISNDAPSMMGGALQGGVAGMGMMQGIQGMQGGGSGWADAGNGTMSSMNQQPNMYQNQYDPSKMFA